MITCPNCRATNAPGVQFCYQCQTPISNQVASSASASNDSLSIDDLLKATESSFLQSQSREKVSSPPSAPAFSAQPNYSYAQPQMPGGYSQSIPPQMPGGFTQTQTTPPLMYHSPEIEQMRRPVGVQQEISVGAHEGYYYFTDEYGYREKLPLASLGKRFGAVILDNIFFFVISFIGTLIVSIILGIGAGSRASNAELSALVINMVIGLFLMQIVLQFLYYVVPIAISGQTMGKRLMKIEVVHKRKRAVGITSALLRVGYNWAALIPNVLAYVAIFNPGVTRNSTLFNTLQVTTSWLPFALTLGILWAIFDKNKQGFHDKLAGTYVVDVSPQRQ
jgi:uncharacterized RDD family membrane protein YckC